MLVERFQKTWRYNNWAWDHVLNSVGKLSEADFKQVRPFFWGSLHGLLAHSLAAEIIWVKRLNGTSLNYLPGVDHFPTLASIEAEWVTVRTDWDSYLGALTDEQALGVLESQSTTGEVRRTVVADIIQHVANHATDHRSQMTPILYQLGAPTPALDYIYYCIQVEPDSV